MTSDAYQHVGQDVFRYTDLPTELREAILEAFVNDAEDNGERLSGLACVSREWQKRVERITFSKLGALCLGSTGEDTDTSSFPAIHLDELERIVIGESGALTCDVS